MSDAEGRGGGSRGKAFALNLPGAHGRMSRRLAVFHIHNQGEHADDS
jgi:hypothetical protein